MNFIAAGILGLKVENYCFKFAKYMLAAVFWCVKKRNDSKKDKKLGQVTSFTKYNICSFKFCANKWSKKLGQKNERKQCLTKIIKAKTGQHKTTNWKQTKK